MNKFLKIKHWQLFILLFGIPLIMQVILPIIFMTSGNTSIVFPVVLILSVVVIGLYAFIFLSWLYALGINLYKKLPDTVSMHIARFKLFLLIPVAYIGALLFFISWSMTLGTHSSLPAVGVAIFIVPIHLFSMFCLFYCLYFVAKALKSVEL